MPLSNGGENFRMRKGCALRRSRSVLAIQNKKISLPQISFFIGHWPDAKFWTLQIRQNAGRLSELRFEFANSSGRAPMILCRAMAEVQSKDIDSGMKQGSDHVGVTCRGTQSGYDLGSSTLIHRFGLQ